MSNRFLISVATMALIAGAGFANAQGMRDTPAAQQSAPAASEHGSPSAAPMNRESGGSAGGMKGESSGMKGPDSGMKAESNEKAQPGAGKSAQDDKMPGQKSKSMSSETETKGGKDMKAEGRDGNKNAETKGTDNKAQTTGNAATAAKGAPPAEKRTQIVSAIKSEKIQETTNVNFNISVGTRVPDSVRFVPLPPRIVEIYPEWRGYDVIFVHGQYIIVRPETHEIVYIIEG
jgi:Protein of unknown function (DUF1236)